MIALRGIGKTFAGVTALDDVMLQVEAGSVHGLLGENGAGKSTLMNICFGMTQPDCGTISIDGAAITMASPRDARRAGIGMVHQHFTLVPTLNAVDNLALSLPLGYGALDRRAVHDSLARLANDLHWSFDLNLPVGRLPIGLQQRVEILKALAGGGRVLILDEPTAVLTPNEVSELIAAVRALAARGAAVVFISHKLAEVERACDRVTILRRGRVVHSGAVAELSRERMAELMVGPGVLQPRVQARPALETATLRLEFNQVSAFDPVKSGPTARPALLQDISFSIRAGEIFGIAGVDGNGQSALVEAALGFLPLAQGIIRGENGGKISRTAIGVIPEDRLRQALVPSLSLMENLLLKDYRRAPFMRGGFLRFAQWRQHASKLVHDFDVRPSTLGLLARSLSGGNQQKLILARELSGEPEVVIAVNPTRGLDLRATAMVLEQLLAARARGAGILLIHSDLDELLAISDRVAVLFAGRLTHSAWPQTTREQIGQLMMGITPEVAHV